MIDICSGPSWVREKDALASVKQLQNEGLLESGSLIEWNGIPLILFFKKSLKSDFFSNCVSLFPICMLSFETRNELELGLERRHWEREEGENTQKVFIEFKAKRIEFEFRCV